MNFPTQLVLSELVTLSNKAARADDSWKISGYAIETTTSETRTIQPIWQNISQNLLPTIWSIAVVELGRICTNEPYNYRGPRPCMRL